MDPARVDASTTPSIAPAAPPPSTGFRCTVHGVDGAVSEVEIRAGHRVLHELQRTRCDTIVVGCRGGGCGVCRVRVVSGTVDAKRMSARFVSADDLADGIVLACRVVPTSDLVLEATPLATGERLDRDRTRTTD